MRENSKTLDKLVYTICGEDEEAYKEVARGMFEFTAYCKHMNDLLYSGFTGKTFEEFEQWKEERATNYKMVMNAYRNLRYRGFD